MNASLRKTMYRVAVSVTSNMEHHWRHVSFICQRNTVIAMGWNQPFKTHPLAFKFDYRYAAIHSELHAILNFPFPVKFLSKYYLVNVRIGKDDKLKMARPCKPCQKLLKAFELNEVYYTDNCGKYIKL